MVVAGTIVDPLACSSLDLSFNLLRSISPLDDSSSESAYAYPKLDHLYLIQNKLTKIEGVKHRTSLTYLEFGGNRIRVSGGQAACRANAS